MEQISKKSKAGPFILAVPIFLTPYSNSFSIPTVWFPDPIIFDSFELNSA